MHVTNLFLKINGTITATKLIRFSSTGIAESKPTSPLRQVLVTQLSILKELRLSPGALRENIVVDVDGLHTLRSGSILRAGAARIRLTFHCEPCRAVASGSLLKKLHHQRGVLGLFLNEGEIHINDPVHFEDADFEEIPYAPSKRVLWYLGKCTAPISARALLHEVGLDRSYARALPNYLRRLPTDLASKVKLDMVRNPTLT